MSDKGGRRFSLRWALVACFVLVGALGIAFPSIAHYGWLSITVVVHSVIDNPRRAQQLGADGVLVKPAPVAAVKALVSRLLGGRRDGDREVAHEPV